MPAGVTDPPDSPKIDLRCVGSQRRRGPSVCPLRPRRRAGRSVWSRLSRSGERRRKLLYRRDVSGSSGSSRSSTASSDDSASGSGRRAGRSWGGTGRRAHAGELASRRGANSSDTRRATARSWRCTPSPLVRCRGIGRVRGVVGGWGEKEGHECGGEGTCASTGNLGWC
eukprot:366196-Chlamydomonas_euryale.AAC.17